MNVTTSGREHETHFIAFPLGAEFHSYATELTPEVA